MGRLRAGPVLRLKKTGRAGAWRGQNQIAHKEEGLRQKNWLKFVPRPSRLLGALEQADV
jgi:hypothetical protein